MFMLTKRSGILTAIIVMFLNVHLGNLDCPYKGQGSTCYNTCNNCFNICKKVDTLDETIDEIVMSSPFYQVIITESNGAKKIDSVCVSFFTIDGMKKFLEFDVSNFVDGTHSVAVYITAGSDGKTALYRSQGLDSESGESSSVLNTYPFGNVTCYNSTIRLLTALYTCYQFADCSIAQGNNEFDDLYVVSDQLDVPSACLDQAEALFDRHGFRKGVLARPPHRLHRKCVTSFNGAPCVNAHRIPPESGLAYPPKL